MRNGGEAYMTLDYSRLKPDPVVDLDPPSIELRVVKPDGTVQETAAYPGTIVKDSVGHYHYTSPALVHQRGGTFEFVAKAPGFPDLRFEMVVEPAVW